jgi:hypothetical protein
MAAEVARPITVNIVTLKKCLAVAVKAAIVVLISGSPGIGKSAAVHEQASDYNLKLIDIRLACCDPTDLNGFPFHFVERGRAGYVPMDTFPLEGDPLPINPDTGKAYQGWLIFFDELTSAPRAVQGASYKVILDRMIGQSRLHPNVVMMAAGNLETDGAIVEELSSALQSRMTHLTLVSDPDPWLDIATKAQIDPRITSFIRYKPGLLNNFDPLNQGAEKTYACERTWFFANDYIKAGLDLDDREVALPLLAGTVGQGVAREFLGHAKMYSGELPSMADIIRDPKNAKLPTAPGHVWGLCGMLAHNARDSNLDPLMQYMARIPLEFQSISLREMGRRNIELFQHPLLADWMLENGADLFA